MSAPLINRRVKVIGTSKVDLNGQSGRAQSYSASSMRYTILLDSGISVALKPANIVPDGAEDEGSGGMPGGMPNVPGMPDVSQVLAMLPPWLREKLMRGEVPGLSDLQRLLPHGVTFLHLGGVVALVFVVFLKVGFLRTALLFAAVGFLAYSGFSAFTEAGGGVRGLKAAAEAAAGEVASRASIATHQRLLLSPSMSLGSLGAVLVAVVYVVFLTGGTTQSPVYAPTFNEYPSPSFAVRPSLEKAYSLGHADGAAGEEADWSRHAPAYSTDQHDYSSPPPSYSPPSSGGGLSSFFSFGKLFTAGLLAKQVYGLGSGGGGWSPELALANVKSMGSMQQGFLALMVLRLFGLSPI